MTRTRVLLADDHRMMAEGVKALLSDEFELVGIVEDGRAMVEAAERLRPDVIIADVAMPNLNGFEALTRLRKSHPNIKVVFLTMHQNAAVRAPRAGRRRLRFRGQAFGPGGIGAGHTRSFAREDIHHSFPDETGGGASRERRARREGRREVPHVAPERDPPIACGGALGKGDCERSCNFRPNRRIPQVPDDGDEWTSQQC